MSKKPSGRGYSRVWMSQQAMRDARRIEASANGRAKRAKKRNGRKYFVSFDTRCHCDSVHCGPIPSTHYEPALTKAVGPVDYFKPIPEEYLEGLTARRALNLIAKFKKYRFCAEYYGDKAIFDQNYKRLLAALERIDAEKHK